MIGGLGPVFIRTAKRNWGSTENPNSWSYISGSGKSKPKRKRPQLTPQQKEHNARRVRKLLNDFYKDLAEKRRADNRKLIIDAVSSGDFEPKLNMSREKYLEVASVLGARGVKITNM